MNETQNQIPQFRQIAETIKRRIAKGEYREGDILPPAAKLEKMFSVSNITIRKALGLLAAEGCAIGRRGLGTIVTGNTRPLRVKIALSNNFGDWLGTAGINSKDFTQTVFPIELRPGPQRVHTLLGLPDETPLWTMRRTRAFGDITISYHINYGREAVLGALTPAMMASNRNFLDVLQSDLGIVLKRMDQTVEAITADRDLARLTGGEFGDPLFFVENAYTSAQDEIVAVTHLYLRGDYYLHQTSMPL